MGGGHRGAGRGQQGQCRSNDVARQNFLLLTTGVITLFGAKFRMKKNNKK